MANSYGQFTFSRSVSNIIKSEPSCTSYTVSVLDFGTFFCNNSSISQPNLMFNTDTAFFLHLSVDSDMHLNFDAGIQILETFYEEESKRKNVSFN